MNILIFMFIYNKPNYAEIQQISINQGHSFYNAYVKYNNTLYNVPNTLSYINTGEYYAIIKINIVFIETIMKLFLIYY